MWGEQKSRSASLSSMLIPVISVPSSPAMSAMSTMSSIVIIIGYKTAPKRYQYQPQHNP